MVTNVGIINLSSHTCSWHDIHNLNKYISLTPNREKKLLVSSEDYGRDLTGVQNLRKKHKRLEAELGAHEPAIQVRAQFIIL